MNDKFLPGFAKFAVAEISNCWIEFAYQALDMLGMLDFFDQRRRQPVKNQYIFRTKILGLVRLTKSS